MSNVAHCEIIQKAWYVVLAPMPPAPDFIAKTDRFWGRANEIEGWGWFEAFIELDHSIIWERAHLLGICGSLFSIIYIYVGLGIASVSPQSVISVYNAGRHDGYWVIGPRSGIYKFDYLSPVPMWYLHISMHTSGGNWDFEWGQGQWIFRVCGSKYVKVP